MGQQVWWHRVDHYYFLTAFLAARGMQAYACRAVAGVLCALGLISLALNWSSSGPRGTFGHLVASAVGLCCLAMAAVWLRPRWPTNVESQACVVVGAACIAAACLVQTDPMAGLFGATAFGLVTAYAAFFHTMRLVSLCWGLVAITLGLLVSRLISRDLSFAVCAALLVVLLVGFISFLGRVAIWLIDADVVHPNLEPLTGLLNHDGFYEKAATLLGASSRDDDRFVMVAVITLDDFSLLSSLGEGGGTDRARVDIAQRLRETTRQNAVLAHPLEHEFLLADVFPTLDASALIDRVHGAIRSAPARMTASIGVVSTPIHPLTGLPANDVLDEIVALASKAMCQARKGGGNLTRYVHGPPLTVVDEPSPPDA